LYTLEMFHPFQQSNSLQTLDTTRAAKYLLKELQPRRFIFPMSDGRFYHN
jgi:hypothetical protein